MELGGLIQDKGIQFPSIWTAETGPLLAPVCMPGDPDWILMPGSKRGLLRKDFLQQIGEHSLVTHYGLTRILQKTSGSLFCPSSGFFPIRLRELSGIKSWVCAEGGGGSLWRNHWIHTVLDWEILLGLVSHKKRSRSLSRGPFSRAALTQPVCPWKML